MRLLSQLESEKWVRHVEVENQEFWFGPADDPPSAPPTLEAQSRLRPPSHDLIENAPETPRHTDSAEDDQRLLVSGGGS